ncbi:hypothetical protein [Falsibacillus pallidus]|uniref:Uncharacterized protein n=1 Tax=Falsibacillus pallidus TaxID=493781 RepID=A0A370GSQ6_9BACI|nr:hypothetical protein [Falsibacillus pallidus]RDI45554.1 hypothetical protein DFR59_102182 [Falsibacillus pallidus]
MKKSMNIISFILSILCVCLFILISFSGHPIEVRLFHIHPITGLLILTVLTFVCGMVGLAGIKNFASLFRSVVTLFITLGISVFLLLVLLIGSLAGVSV